LIRPRSGELDKVFNVVGRDRLNLSPQLNTGLTDNADPFKRFLSTKPSDEDLAPMGREFFQEEGRIDPPRERPTDRLEGRIGIARKYGAGDGEEDLPLDHAEYPPRLGR
jgi:hypothetical protein